MLIHLEDIDKRERAIAYYYSSNATYHINILQILHKADVISLVAIKSTII